MNRPKLSLISAACAYAVAAPAQVHDREPDIKDAITRLAMSYDPGTETPPPMPDYDLLRAVWGHGYETCESDGAAFLGAAGKVIAESRDLLGRAAAQLTSSHYPTAPPFPDAWRPEFEALAAFLMARDRKCDDGDSLQAWADAGTALTAQLGISTGLDRAIEALVDRRERQKRTGDVGGARATDSALDLVRACK